MKLPAQSRSDSLTQEAHMIGELQRALMELPRLVEGIKGVVLTDPNGLPVAAHMNVRLDLNVICAMSGLVTQSTSSVFENIGLNGPEFIFMEGAGANVAAMAIEGGASLLVIAEKNANLGLLKIEMKRAAAAIARVLGSATARLEELFLIYQGGILIRHYSSSLRTDIDRDILSGMLTAVQQFVKETLATRSGNLDEMRYGEYTVCFVRGTHVTAAGVVKGRSLENLKYEISDALQEFEETFAAVLAHWDGSMQAFPGVDDIFVKLLGS